MKTFGTEFQNFSEKGSFSPKKTYFRGFGGTLAGRALQPWPLGMQI